MRDNIKKVNILGINISQINKKEAIKRVAEYLDSGRKHYIATPNPEIILKALKDEEFFTILNNADLAIADGIGLKFAAWTFFSRLPRVSGSDLSLDILSLAEKKGIKTGIIIWEKGLTKKTELEEVLLSKYRKLKFKAIASSRAGGKGFKKMAEFDPEILLVGLGAPWQEKLIKRNLDRCRSLKLAAGVGGTFDFISGKISRCPKIIRSFGLEWLWRVFKQPKRKKIWRLKRIYNATVVFTVKFLRWRFILPFVYRKNVACLLYRKDKRGEISVLLVERSGEKDHWQIPQGGTDGLSIEAAGKKEIKEELGTDKFVIKGSYNYFYKYEFSDELNKNIHRGSAYHRHTGYKGQKQGLLVARFTGDDEDIKINDWDHRDWKWVGLAKALEAVHPCRRRAMSLFLEKFRKIDNK